jgi:hypothetical protein
MKAMSLEEAVATVRSMPAHQRAAALRGFARAEGAGWTVLDPRQCTPYMAERCDYRGGPGNGRICLVAVDQSTGCPYADYVP